jgi:alpha-glucosidase
VQDPWEKNEPGLGFGRDPARTPMPWDRSANAGFTDATPWLPLNRDWRERNVEALAADPGSILTLYRRLIALRRAQPALNSGDYVHAHVEGDLYAYERRHGDARLLVALNFGHKPQTLTLPEDAAEGRLLLSTFLDREEERVSGMAELRPAEGVVIDLEGQVSSA